jgi:intracellular septation protein
VTQPTENSAKPTDPTNPTPASPRSSKALIKTLLELGPLVLFFAANARPEWFKPLLQWSGLTGMDDVVQTPLFMATAVFMVAMLVSLVLSWVLMRHIAVMPLVSGIIVLIFGGLTLYLRDETFIKLKPTIVNVLFGSVLLGGLLFGRSFLRITLESVLSLDEEGWRKLTFRWGVFFFVLAGLNELVWRTQSTDTWINFKVFCIMPLTMTFAILQTPLLSRHQLPQEGDKP